MTVQFGYAGKWYPDYASVAQAAYLAKSDPTPVGVEITPAVPVPYYRLVTNQQYYQAAQSGRLVWTA